MLLDNFNTGYEGRFDFPPRSDGPDRTYLLASVPRAGSTYFSHILWRTGCLGAPLEYLNFERLGPYGFASASAELQLELWRSVVRRRCSPNGVFGLKAFTPQFQELERSNQPLLENVFALMLPRGGPRYVVYLRRRDRIAQRVSYARAALSGVWRKDQEGGEPRPVQYSEEALAQAEGGIEQQESTWERMFDELGIKPLRMWHEDVLENPAAAAQQVADHLGVALDPAAAVEVPAIEEQSNADSKAWLERYRQARP